MRGSIRAASLALSGLLALQSGGCPSDAPPPPSVGHDRNQAGQPDPAPNAPKQSDAVSVRFTVITNVEVVVTYNAGHGNKFIDSLKHTESWTVGAPARSPIYISATPAKRGSHGTISVKAENAATGKLLCHDTNFDNLNAGADCHGTAK